MQHIYGTPSCHSRHCREEGVCGRQSADNTTCHGFKSVLRCRSTSLESTPCIFSSHGPCRNFQASSQNFTVYGGIGVTDN